MPIYSADEFFGTKEEGGGGALKGLMDQSIKEASEKYGVPESHIRAVAKHESAFKQSATSPKGARGVMQIMPGTAVGLAKGLGVKPDQVLNDMHYNIMGGTAYLADLNKQFGGDWEKTIAAYNAGPNRIASGRSWPEETKKFVKNVLGTLDKTSLGTFARSAVDVGSGSLGRILHGATSQEAAHTPITEMGDYKMPTQQEMVAQTYIPAMEGRELGGIADRFAAILGGVLGAGPEFAQSMLNTAPVLGPFAGASPLLQLAARAGAGALGFGAMELNPGVPLSHVAKAAGTGAALGPVSAVPGLLTRAGLGGTIMAGHRAMVDPNATLQDLAATGLAGASIFGGAGAHPLRPAAPRPSVAPRGRATVLPEGYLKQRMNMLDSRALDVPPWIRARQRFTPGTTEVPPPPPEGTGLWTPWPGTQAIVGPEGTVLMPGQQGYMVPSTRLPASEYQLPPIRARQSLARPVTPDGRIMPPEYGPEMPPPGPQQPPQGPRPTGWNLPPGGGPYTELPMAEPQFKMPPMMTESFPAVIEPPIRGTPAPEWMKASPVIEAKDLLDFQRDLGIYSQAPREIVPDEIIPPGVREADGQVIDVDVVSPSWIRSKRRTPRKPSVKAKKEAPPAAVRKGTETTTRIPNTPELRAINERLKEIDSYLETQFDTKDPTYLSLLRQREELMAQVESMAKEAPTKGVDEAMGAFDSFENIPENIQKILGMPETDVRQMIRKAVYLEKVGQQNPEFQQPMAELAKSLRAEAKAQAQPKEKGKPTIKSQWVELPDGTEMEMQTVPEVKADRWAPPEEAQTKIAKAMARKAARDRKAGITPKPTTPVIELPRGPTPPPIGKVSPAIVTGAHEPGVPTRVAVRQLGDTRYEYITTPPAEPGEPWRLVKSIYKGDRLDNQGAVFSAKSYDKLMEEVNQSPEVRLAKRVFEPMDYLETKSTFQDPGLESMEGGIPEPGEGQPLPDWMLEPDTYDLMPPQQQDMAATVERMYDRMDAEFEAAKAKGWRKWLQIAQRNWTDFARPMKDVLKVAGPAGDHAVMMHQLSAGSMPKSIRVFEKLKADVYGGLNRHMHKALDRFITSKRIISIDDVKGEGVVQHPEGRGKAWHEAYLRSIPRDILAELEPRAALYFQHMRSLLDLMRDEGLLTPGAYRALARDDVLYSPRKFIQYLEGAKEYTFGGKQLTVNGSGLQKLKEGSIRALETDTMAMAAEYTNRTYAKIFRNRANRALLKIADDLPDLGLVRRLTAEEKAKPHETTIHVVSDRPGELGKTVRMAIPNEMAEGWILADPQISSGLAKMLQIFSGTKVIKAMATGYNPAFGLANLPRDILHVFFSTFEYSSNPIRFAGQMAKDLKNTFRDAWYKTGRFDSMIDEGGGMQFLATQGRTERLFGIEKLDKVADAVAKFGEFTETWVRLALRDRNLQNQAKAVAAGQRTAIDPYEATHVARNYMDFYQGGRYAKFLDNVLPYFNASIVGMRGIGRAAKARPGLMAWKVANIGFMAAGLALANEINSPETMKSISKEVKNTNWIISFGDAMSYKDEAGNTKRLYFTIPKDQFSRVVSSLFEEAATSSIGKAPDGWRIASAMKDFGPLLGNNLPPAVKVYFGFDANWDAWRGQAIWKGPKVEPGKEYYTARMGREPTHPLAVEWGRLTNISPVKSAYAVSQLFTSSNPFVVGTSELFASAFGDPDGRAVKEKTFAEAATRYPMVSRFWKSTSPYAEYGEQVAQYATDVNTARLEQNRVVDNLAELYAEDKNQYNLQNLKDYIKTQPPIDQKSLVERFMFGQQVYNYPNRDWWLHTLSLPAEAKAKAFHDRYVQLDKEGQQDLLRKALSLRGYGGDKFKFHLRQLLFPRSETQGG